MYNPDHLPNRFGFTLNEDGILSPLAGTQDKRVRLPLLRGTAFLLGIGRQAMRDVWLAIDFLDENKSFSIFSGTLGEGRVPFEGTFLDLLDSRQIEKIEKPKAVHLESLVNRAAEAHEVKRYLVLLNDSLLEVDRNGYRLTTNCEQYLSAL